MLAWTVVSEIQSRKSGKAEAVKLKVIPTLSPIEH